MLRFKRSNQPHRNYSGDAFCWCGPAKILLEGQDKPTLFHNDELGLFLQTHPVIVHNPDVMYTISLDVEDDEG
jgi:hypothetical protein